MIDVILEDELLTTSWSIVTIIQSWNPRRGAKSMILDRLIFGTQKSMKIELNQKAAWKRQKQGHIAFAF